MVLLRNKKINKYAFIHRLVAEAFIPNPENKRTINHKDGNKRNNNYWNLEWATYSENNKHSYTINPNAKDKLREYYVKRFSKKVAQYSLDYKLIQEWSSVSDASRALNISTGSISLCATGKQNKSCGFIWRYI